MSRLNSLVTQRLGLFRQSIALYQQDSISHPKPSFDYRKERNIRDEIQGVLADIKNKEERVLRVCLLILVLLFIT
jgi:hypothetical protein